MIEEAVPVPTTDDGSYYRNQGYGLAMNQAKANDYNPTVRENLEHRIAKLKQELADAEASMLTLAPLLDIKIRDIRRAMDY